MFRSVLTAVLVAVLAAPLPGLADTSEIMVGVHGTMHATLVTPNGPGPYPGVLVLHTSGGLREADIIYAQQLAREGYVCLIPAFMAAYGIDAASRADTFGRYGDSIYADLVQALGVLQKQPQVHGSALGAVGFSNGGYFATWLALTGKVRAAVSYYGAYTAAGTDIDESRFRAAAAATSSPLLILHGLNDDTVPAEAARRLASILDAVHAPYVIQLYPATGHAFDRGGFVASTAFRNPGTKNAKTQTGPDSGDDAAETDAWARTLDFFKNFLPQP
jgi:carboxymethylenebutenolidase